METGNGSKRWFLLVGILCVWFSSRLWAAANSLEERLWEATRNEDHEKVSGLIEAGADVNTANKQGVTSLYCAAGWGNVKIVRELLAAQADVNAAGYYGRTPLHRATHYGHEKVIRELLIAGADVDATDKNGWSPMHYASVNDHHMIVPILLKAGGDVTLRTTREDSNIPVGKTALEAARIKGNINIVRVLGRHKQISSSGDLERHLREASRRGDLANVKRLIGLGAKVNASTQYSETPLHNASEHGHIEVVRVLLQAGAQICAPSISLETQLHCAARNGHLEIVRELQQAGADVNAADRYRVTPLYLAAREGHFEVVEYLVEFGADMNIKTKGSSFRGDKTPLDVARSRGKTDVVSFLEQAPRTKNLKEKRSRGGRARKAQVNEARNHAKVAEVADVHPLMDFVEGQSVKGDGLKSLRVSANGGQPEVVCEVLQAGSPVGCARGARVKPLRGSQQSLRVRSEGNCELQLRKASKVGDVDQVQRLLAIGTKVNATTSDGLSPLHHAACKGHLKVVQELLKGGAQVDARNSFGETPLHLTIKSGHLGVVRELLHAGADINDEDAAGNTSFHLAQAHGHSEISTLLEQAVRQQSQASEESYRLVQPSAPQDSDLVAQREAEIRALRKQLEEQQKQLAQLEQEMQSQSSADSPPAYHEAVHLSPASVAKPGKNPLIETALSANLQTMTSLLENGIYSLDARDERSYALLHIATEQNNEQMARLLIHHGAPVNVMVHDGARRGWTPLHFAVAKKNHELVQHLLEASAYPSIPDCKGDTPLHWAVSWKSVPITQLLLKAGARPDTRNQKGKSPLSMAQEKNNAELVALLEQYLPEEENRGVRCCICLDDLDASEDQSYVVARECGHVLHTVCSEGIIDCPYCREPLGPDSWQRLFFEV